MLNILHVIGARPHFMKLAPVYEALEDHPDVNQIIVHTGQHYDFTLSEQFIQEFNLPSPHYNLEVGSKSHLSQIANILIGLESVLNDQEIHLVVVYGDTNSTAAGAIAAAKLNIPLAHVEAGLREWDRQIPEEVNKLLTDAVTDLYFCPSEIAVNNLKNAGITENVFLTGDVVVAYLLKHVEARMGQADLLNELDLEPNEYCFATCHRANNTDEKGPLAEIMSAFAELDTKVVFAAHPRTLNAIRSFGLDEMMSHQNIHLIEPQSFWNTQCLIKNANLVLTDSGGVIKESHLYRTPSLILDTQTEWLEIVESGWSVITGPNKSRIVESTKKFEIPQSHQVLYHIENGPQLIAETIVKFAQANVFPES